MLVNLVYYPNMQIFNVFEAKAKLSELLEKVRAGQQIVIARYGEPIAILSPYKATKKKRKFGALKGSGSYEMSEDFNDPLPLELFGIES